MIEKIPSFFFTPGFLIIAGIFSFFISVYFVYKIILLFRLKRLMDKLNNNYEGLILPLRYLKFNSYSKAKTALLTDYYLAKFKESEEENDRKNK